MFWQVFSTSFLFLTTVSAIHKQYRDNFDCARRTILFVRILATNWNRNKKRRQQTEKHAARKHNQHVSMNYNTISSQNVVALNLSSDSRILIYFTRIVSLVFRFSRFLFSSFCCCYLLWNCSRIVYYIFFFFLLLRLPNQFTHKYIRFWVLRWENKLKCFIYALIRRTRTDQTPIEQFNLFFFFGFFPSHFS